LLLLFFLAYSLNGQESLLPIEHEKNFIKPITHYNGNLIYVVSNFPNALSLDKNRGQVKFKKYNIAKDSITDYHFPFPDYIINDFFHHKTTLYFIAKKGFKNRLYVVDEGANKPILVKIPDFKGDISSATISESGNFIVFSGKEEKDYNLYRISKIRGKKKHIWDDLEKLDSLNSTYNEINPQFAFHPINQEEILFFASNKNETEINKKKKRTYQAYYSNDIKYFESSNLFPRMNQTENSKMFTMPVNDSTMYIIATSTSLNKNQLLYKPRRIIPQSPKKYYGLFVGISDYLPPIQKFKYPTKDITEISNVLKDWSFQDSTNRLLPNASLKQIRSSLNYLKNTLEREDYLLIYLSGHGTLSKDSTEWYFLPQDATLDSIDTWLSETELRNYLNDFSADNVIIIADACYSGALSTNERKKGGIKRSSRIITNTDKTSVAYDDHCFTGCLLNFFKSDEHNLINNQISSGFLGDWLVSNCTECPNSNPVEINNSSDKLHYFYFTKSKTD